MKPFVEELRKRFATSIHAESDDRGDLSLYVNKDRIIDILKHLKESGFEFLIDICGVDYPERSTRFDVVNSFLTNLFGIQGTRIMEMLGFHF